ncbi:MAG: hypothetical protein GXP09_12220 [Gammaproteobacteria bacterium]|nr:hypothetical protein [Gammaproteobacteria bacterium]
MKHFIKTLAVVMFAALGLLRAESAWSLTSASVAPSATAITTTSNTVSLTWSIGESGPSTVSSPTGTYVTPSGTVLGTVSVLLSTTIAADTVIPFPETITVPTSVITAAATAGATQILYKRTFTGTNPVASLTVSATLDLASVSKISVSPSVATVTPGMTTVIPVSWKVDLTSGKLVSIVSKTGEFITASGARLGVTVPTTLSTTATTSKRLNESLSVPASVVVTALNRGAKKMRYVRTFLIDGSEYEAFLTLDIKGLLTGVSATPTQARVTLGRSSAVTIRWVAKLAGSISGGITVRSTSGQFISPTGVPLGNISGNLSRLAIGTSVTFNETIQVPRDVVYRAQKQGASSLLLTRQFSDGISMVTAKVTLHIAGGSSGAFTLNRVALLHKDGQRLRVVNRRERLQVIADITYGGSGRLDADWEIATPTSSGGVLIFRSLKLVRKYLSGFGQVRLESPTLPTTSAGQYVVRLRINTPAMGSGSPTISYFVTVSRPRTQHEVKIITPDKDTLLTTGVRFAWQPVTGAAFYQIEVHPQLGSKTGDSRLVAGLAVPASQRETNFSRLTYEYLSPGRRYRWRIVAINKTGEVIAASAYREISTP